MELSIDKRLMLKKPVGFPFGLTPEWQTSETETPAFTVGKITVMHGNLGYVLVEFEINDVTTIMHVNNVDIPELFWDAENMTSLEMSDALKIAAAKSNIPLSDKLAGGLVDYQMNRAEFNDYKVPKTLSELLTMFIDECELNSSTAADETENPNPDAEFIENHCLVSAEYHLACAALLMAGIVPVPAEKVFVDKEEVE